MNSRPKTIIIDLDGTLVHHYNRGLSFQATSSPPLLEGTIDRLNTWDSKGYNIIILSGRRESQRAATEKYLQEVGVFYDQLIMNIGGGVRFLINDRKPDSDEDTAFAINLKRNAGIKDVEI